MIEKLKAVVYSFCFRWKMSKVYLFRRRYSFFRSKSMTFFFFFPGGLSGLEWVNPKILHAFKGIFFFAYLHVLTEEHTLRSDLPKNHKVPVRHKLDNDILNCYKLKFNYENGREDSSIKNIFQTNTYKENVSKVKIPPSFFFCSYLVLRSLFIELISQRHRSDIVIFHRTTT